MLQLLSDVLGQGTEKSKGNHAFYCPFCRHRKQKLEVQPEVGVWACWACGNKGKTILSLFKRIGVTDGIMQRYYVLNPKFKSIKSNTNVNKIIQLPKEFRPLYEKRKSIYWKNAYNYATETRRLTDVDLYKHNIGYAEDGKYKNMLIVPNYNANGQLNFFSTRNYMGHDVKFINNTQDKNLVGFELQLSPHQPLIIAEGALDAMTVRFNGTPLYGKLLSSNLKIYILENEIKDIYICLDPDAVKQSLSYLKYLKQFGITTYFVNFPEHTDLNSLGFDKAWQYINAARPMTDDELFEQEVRFKLK